MPLLERNRFKCIVCKKRYTTLSSLRRHRKLHTGEKPYACSVCTMRFSYATSLNSHMRNHTGDKPHQCSACSRAFSRLHYLQRHLRWHTGEKPHACSDCGKGYADSTHLARHMLTHTGEKPHKCSECDKGFTTLSNLKAHRMTHTGEKPHACSVCGVRFSRAGSLHSHMQRVHTQKDTGESSMGNKRRQNPASLPKSKPSKETVIISSPPCQHLNMYRAHKLPETDTNRATVASGQNIIVVERCSDCNKLFRHRPLNDTCHHCQQVFRHPPDLYKHTAAHSCSVCHQSFCQLSYLNEHVITHADGFYHKCSECDRIFIDASKYLKHKETHRETPQGKNTDSTDCQRAETTRNKTFDLKSRAAEHNYAAS